MSSKELFTEDEWHILQWAVTDTMAYLAVADHGFWDTFKEATAAAKFMATAKADTQQPAHPRPRRRHQDGPRQAGHARHGRHGAARSRSA